MEMHFLRLFWGLGRAWFKWSPLHMDWADWLKMSHYCLINSSVFPFVTFLLLSLFSDSFSLMLLNVSQNPIKTCTCHVPLALFKFIWHATVSTVNTISFAYFHLPTVSFVAICSKDADARRQWCFIAAGVVQINGATAWGNWKKKMLCVCKREIINKGRQVRVENDIELERWRCHRKRNRNENCRVWKLGEG